MTYAVNEVISAVDINGFISTNTPNFNKIWSTGTSNFGYGQTALTTVTVGAVVNHNPWDDLINKMANVGSHTGSTITAITAPVTGDKVVFYSALSTNLTTINTNRLNAASQGGTTSGSGTRGSTWSQYCTFTCSIAFGTDDAARYFFNAGGQIAISTSHPAGAGSSINQLINNICSDMGTVWVSSQSGITLAGSSWDGVTKVGGGYPAGTTVSSGSGFYSLSGEIFRQYGDFAYSGYGAHPNDTNYTTGTFLAIAGSYNGAGTITLTLTIDEVPNGAIVSAGTTCTVVARAPSSTYLSNTWGTPVIGVTPSAV